MENTRRNIAGLSTTRQGLPLNIGLESVCTFDLVTSAPAQFNETVSIRYGTSQNTSNDYFSNNLHLGQFSANSQSILVDGQSYNNNFTARYGQFIAPKECYIKNINGFINTAGGGGCNTAETFVISVWKKSSVAGTSSTAISLLFSQSFVFTGSSNTNVLAIDGVTDSKVGDKLYKINSKEGVIVSVKRELEERQEPCANINAKFTIIFEDINNEAETKSLSFTSLVLDESKFCTMLSEPPQKYKHSRSGDSETVIMKE